VFIFGLGFIHITRDACSVNVTAFCLLAKHYEHFLHAVGSEELQYVENEQKLSTLL
jgi:hypothetical protein